MSLDGGAHAATATAGTEGYAMPPGLDRKSLMERPKLSSLDADYHESTHSKRSMSSRRLVTNRHDDLLRSGSTHQLLNRPTGRFTSSAVVAPVTSAGASVRETAAASASATVSTEANATATAGENSLQGTEETAEDSESNYSEESFCDASGDCAADKEYLRKDLGASLHDDELDFDSDDGEDEEELAAEMEKQMKIEGGPLGKKKDDAGEDEIMGGGGGGDQAAQS